MKHSKNSTSTCSLSDIYSKSSQFWHAVFPLASKRSISDSLPWGPTSSLPGLSVPALAKAAGCTPSGTSTAAKCQSANLLTPHIASDWHFGKNTHTKRRETSWKIHKIHGFCKHLHQTYLTYLATAWHLPDPFCSRWKTWSLSRNSGQLGKSKDSTSWNSSSGKRWTGGLLDKNMSNFYLIHK